MFFVPFAVAQPAVQSETIAKKEEKIIPIGFMESSDIHFVVPIPDEYKLGSRASQGNYRIYEYIPKDDDMNLWKEIISITWIDGKDRAGRDDFMKSMLSVYEKSSYPCEHWEKIENGLQIGLLTVDMPSAMPVMDSKQGTAHMVKLAGKKERTAFKVIEGNLATCVVQYSIRYDQETTTSKACDAIRKRVMDYLQTCQTKAVKRN